VSHTVPIIRQKSGAVRVNAADVELLLLNGWQLTDEPDCSGARMVPPGSIKVDSECVNRVPKKKTGQGGQSLRPVKTNFHNDRNRTTRSRAQAR
jgi:hypothetical protein